MDDVREAAESLLAADSAYESLLRDILDVDADGPWEFDDVAADSGEFGEIVSRGLVTQTDEGYRLADREAVRVALSESDERLATGSEDETGQSIRSRFDANIGLKRITLSRSVVVPLGVVVFLALLLRGAVPFGDVVRDQIVLLGNDPYQRLYYVESLLETELTAFNPIDLATVRPEIQEKGVLLVVLLWWGASLFGGSAGAAQILVALYPLVAGLLSIVFVYWITERTTRDARVSLAAAAFLATVPVHVFRTALGFADHHAFDYFWLSLTMLALVSVVSETDSQALRRRLADRALPVVALGIGIAGQLLSWRGGPLFLFPLGIYLAVRVAVDVRDGRSPLEENAPVLAGIAVGTVLMAVAGILFPALQGYRVGIPVLLLVGSGTAVVLGEAVSRTERSARTLAVFYVLATGAFAGVIGIFGFGIARALADFRGFLLETSARPIAETISVFSGELGILVGPLLLFGAVFYLGVVYLLRITVSTDHIREPRWLLLVVYTWWFTLLTLVQIRFGGPSSLFLSIFAGIGFVHLASVVDITSPPAILDTGTGPSVSLPDPREIDRTTVRNVSLLFLLVGGFALVQAPIKTSQLGVSDTTYETATWIESHAAAANETYPENYVFSRWSTNRVYNYFVSGESESYNFAQRYYNRFASADDEQYWYERLHDRVGYVVTKSRTNSTALHERLHGRFGSAASGDQGVAHFRAVRATADRSRVVFELVPGAIVTGTAPANETVTAASNVSVSGHAFTYRRTVRATMNGRYAVVVPYAGSYRTDGGRKSNTVSAAQVTGGEFVTDSRPVASWSFDEGRGRVLFDERGGNHGLVTNGSWVPGVDGRALALRDSGYVNVTNDRLGARDGFTVSTWFRTDAGVNYSDQWPRLVSHARYRAEAIRGYEISIQRGRIVGAIGDGTNERRLFGPAVDDDAWHRASLVWNGTHVSLALDGRMLDTRSFSGRPDPEVPFAIGKTSTRRSYFTGFVDRTQVRREALNGTELARTYQDVDQ